VGEASQNNRGRSITEQPWEKHHRTTVGEASQNNRGRSFAEQPCSVGEANRGRKQTVGEPREIRGPLVTMRCARACGDIRSGVTGGLSDGVAEPHRRGEVGQRRGCVECYGPGDGRRAGQGRGKAKSNQRSSRPSGAARRCAPRSRQLAGWEIHRGRWRWRDESGGSVRIERAVGALVAASRGAEWERDLPACFRESRIGLRFIACP